MSPWFGHRLPTLGSARAAVLLPLGRAALLWGLVAPSACAGKDREPSLDDPSDASACEQHCADVEPEPREVFSPCSSSDDCGDDARCLPTRQARFVDRPLCVPTCEDDADCFSGCCGRLDTGDKVCGFPADCAPVAVGYPCFDPSDCASGSCRWGSCVEECESDEDCGTNQLGLPNHCYAETQGDGTTLSACLPGCSDNGDCRYYYEEPFYAYQRGLDPVPLSCVGGAGAGYCF